MTATKKGVAAKATTARREAAVNVVKLDAKNPIPIETEGKGYIISRGRKYAPFLDDKDNFFQIILEAGLLSPTNRSCVNSKSKFSIGKGIVSKNEDELFKQFSKKVNAYGQSLSKLLKKIFTGYFSCGNVFVNLVKVTVGKKVTVHAYVKNHMDCRLLLPEKGTGLPTQVVISKNFRRKGTWNLTDESEYSIVNLYNGDPAQKWTKLPDGNEHLIIHLKHEEEGYDYYGMPSNIACLPQQILEYKMARANLDNLDNGLAVGGLILLSGNLSSDEAKLTAQKITNAHAGDGKRGKYVVLAAEGNENSKVIPFDNTKEYDYVEGDKRVEEKILFANEWSKTLIDPSSSGLNSGKFIRELYGTKMNTVISPVQSFVIDEFLMPYLTIVDSMQGTKFAQQEYMFANLPILGIANEVDVNSVITVDEGRAMLGLAELGTPEGKQIVKQKTNSNVPG